MQVEPAAGWSSNHNPSNLFVAGFLGAPSMNIIPRWTSESVADAPRLRYVPRLSTAYRYRPADAGSRGGDKAILAVRPQYLTPTDPDKGMLHGTVALTERLGAETVIDITLRDGSSIIAAVAEDRVLQPGTEIGLNFEATRAHLFADEALQSQPH